MWVFDNLTVARKMLGNCCHARLSHSFREFIAKPPHNPRVRMKRPVTDCTALVVQVKDWRKTDVNPIAPKFPSDYLAGCVGRIASCCGVLVKGSTDHLHGRHSSKSLSESLDSTPFLIDCHQQRRCLDRLDLGYQLCELFGAFEISAEENDATDSGMPQAFAGC